MYAPFALLYATCQFSFIVVRFNHINNQLNNTLFKWGLSLHVKLILILTVCFFIAPPVNANPQHLNGAWYIVHDYASSKGSAFLANPLKSIAHPVKSVSLIGGSYLYLAPIKIAQAGEYVLDFKNTSTIGRFRHQLYDSQNKLVATMQGGIESEELNPFLLRHGREVTLSQGDYTLATELISTNYLAIPEPYIDDRTHYQQAIKPTSLITLVGLGVFLGLGIYYTALAERRSGWAEAMYACFILGNLVFNGAALLVLSDVFGIHSMYFVSTPVLLSNIAYIVFVMHLLEIKKHTQKHLYLAGEVAIAVMLLFLVIAMIYPNWALELSRYGVAMFLSYGLVAAVKESLHRNATAKRYLIAIALFFLSGLLTITLNKIDSQFTLYIEHMGLISVVIEVILLALVLSFQFSQLHKDKERALEELEVSVKTAHSDALTGLPNRHALVKEFVHLPVYGSLTFIDLDGLKFYNDSFGHERGDALLCAFAERYQQSLGEEVKLYRLGGDEFAVLNHKGDIHRIEHALDEALKVMKSVGFEFSGASAGSVHAYEAEDIASLMRLADERMYEVKRLRKLNRENMQEQLKFNP
jgi:diguanylate cyclase